ncbi:probable mannitol dehydrogenase [Chenopodium quinoa]|uniref:Enoyl reductase (ER) domain-containing protein n=1 Tax=Chenopodium quinoa TaxID=63459 RepID=A0A803KXD6_CHEQI|nr:probable mannitol dehydrogenase [Chenopodium quinoa]
MAGASEDVHPQKAFGWAARDSSGVLSPFNFSRRATGEQDVTFKVLYVGICHSDLHYIKNEWGSSDFISANYPAVPGHEIVGVVTEVGMKVQKFKVGYKVGVGCMVGSCRSCDNCGKNLENYCPKMLLTYGSTYYDGTNTYGGYSDIMVVDEHFAVHIPENMALDATAPLLCAGITVYSPLRYYGLDKPGLHVGVVGLGGLGHMAVKFAKALGTKVTVISTSANKKDEAVKRLGADFFLVSRDPEQMQAATGTLDGIIDTVSAPHPLLPLISLLKTEGKLITVGAPDKPLELPVFPLIMGRKMVGGSGIGGMMETQEMIDFAAKHDIKADIEVIPMDYVNTAMERLHKADVSYRFVIDIGNTLKAT